MIKAQKHSIPIRVYDFFSGCGGTSLGFGQAGIQHALAVDSCQDAVSTFIKNFPGVNVINEPIETLDVKRIQSHFLNVPEVKLFCGCAPCQPFTKQKTNTILVNSKDERRELLTYFAEMVHQCLPELVFIENVPGLQKVTLGAEGPFSRLIDQLEKDKYFCSYGVITAQDYGAAQFRRRLVLVASRLGKIDLPLPTHGMQTPNKFVTVWDAISELPSINHGEEHPDTIRYPNHRAARLSKLNLERIQNTKTNGRRDWPDRLLPDCYTKKKNGNRYTGHTDCYTRLAWHESAPGLTTRCISYSNGRFGHPEQDRAISVREAARLQGFPDNFIFTGSLNSMARQIGNAVPVSVARAFGIHFVNHVKKAGLWHG